MATILVADDNSNIQKMVGIALKDHGIDVVAVGNGEAAVRRIPDVHPDLILADIFMPVKNGYEVCEFVKKNAQYSHIPVILLVGAFDPLDEHEAQRVGADGVLKKPFIPPDPLINVVKSALARAGESRRPIPVPVAVPEPVLAAVAHSDIAEKQQAQPSGPAAVTFGDTNRPVAFGSLLETEPMEAEAEVEAYVAPVPHPELSDSRNWGVAPSEEEVEEEEEPQPSWRAHSVPDELLTDESEPSLAASPYADAVLTEKEDIGISTGNLAAENARVEAAPATSSEAIERGFFAQEPSQQEPNASETSRQEFSTVEVQPIPQGGANVAASEEPAHQETSESQASSESVEQVPEPVAEKRDYESVFTADAFPGLFVEEKAPTAIELGADSLQESPSAFAELSAGIGGPLPDSPVQAMESHSAGVPLSEPKPEEATVAKLPSLWEEQVRHAARLIASAWPGAHKAGQPAEDQSASWHSNAPAPFSTGVSDLEPQTIPNRGESEPVKNIETPWHASNSTPAPDSWLPPQHDRINSEEPIAEQASSLATSALSTKHNDVPANSASEEHDSGGSARGQHVFAHDGYDAWAAMPEPATDASAGWGAAAHEPVTTSPAPLESGSGESNSLSQSVESANAVHASAVAEPPAQSTTTQAPTLASTETSAAPNLEDVVAKVLARMNPEMFQSVTQQLLKPVIEAIVRSELEKK